jgi:hypothetical protein
MALLRPDSTFYPSPKMAMRAPTEILAYVVVLSPNDNGRPDALAVLDVDPVSETSGQVVGRVEKPNAGDELHERTGYSCPHTVHCGPEAFMWVPWVPRMATDRAASSSWTTNPSSLWDAGRSSAVRSTSPTTSGGTWATTP